MRNYIKRSIAVCFLAITITACSSNNYLNSEQLHYLEKQATRTLQEIPKGAINIPRNVNNGADKWRYVDYEDWTRVLWYLFEATNQEKWKIEADKFTRELTRLSVQKAVDHDLGFQIFNSFGNGYRLTHNEEYKKVILRTADSLATLFNPNTGTILSWPRSVPNLEWPQHNTIMDNMINLEMLFWASKNGGGRELYDMAVSHAQVTMKNAFRPDYSSYHVVVYDRNTGKKIKAVTHQGYSDESMWARGQAWAIYGFTMCYRESKRSEFLEFAQKVTDVYLERLPPDLIPYWDFNDPGIPNAPKDASAAAITASAMLELSTFVADKVKASLYRKKAEQILAVLSSDKYLSKDTNSSFLLHSTGHKPNGLEIDASITYADYYYIEALIRADRLQRSEPLK